MIIELPKKFSIGDSRQKNDAFVEDGILKMRRTASFKHVMYELTFELKGGKHQCKYCGRFVNNKKITMDHIYPQDMGGPTIPNNLAPACEECNREKTNMTEEQYKSYKHLKNNEIKKEYLKKIQKEKELIKLRGGYEIPEEWICQKKINSIIAEIRLGDVTQSQSYQKVKRFYFQYGHFQKPIVLDKNGYLLDGFYTVIFAKKHDIEKIPIIQLENVEIIF